VFREQFEAIADYASGNANLTQLERRFADAAGVALVNVATANALSKGMGHGWKGQPLVTINSSGEFRLPIPAGQELVPVPGGAVAVAEVRPLTVPMPKVGLGPPPRVLGATALAMAATTRAGGTGQRKPTRAEQIKINEAQGKAFEQQVEEFARETQVDVKTQVSIRPNRASGPAEFRFRPDTLGRERPTSKIEPLEAKSSESAPLTPRQEEGIPLLEDFGGTVVGKKGGTEFPAGTVIPPGTKVRVVRPKDLPKKKP
jgi:hypothetical protein